MSPAHTKRTVEPSSVMNDYLAYVHQYLEASALMDKSAAVFWPKVHVRGLCVELALKAYLHAVGEPMEGHDLVDLAKQAVTRGLELQDIDWSQRIESLNQIYFKHIELGQKYLSRYPMPNRPTLVTVTPHHAAVVDVVERILNQARNAIAIVPPNNSLERSRDR